jgi:hypothetical protein
MATIFKFNPLGPDFAPFNDSVGGGGNNQVAVTADPDIATFVTNNYPLGTEYIEGDIIILPTPAEAWVHNGGSAGTTADFTIFPPPASSAAIRALFSSTNDAISYNASTGEFTFTSTTQGVVEGEGTSAQPFELSGTAGLGTVTGNHYYGTDGTNDNFGFYLLPSFDIPRLIIPGGFLADNDQPTDAEALAYAGAQSANPGTLLVYAGASGSTGTAENPSHSWFFDGTNVTRIKDMPNKVSIDAATTDSGAVLTPFAGPGTPVTADALTWFTNNATYAREGTMLYYVGGGNHNEPDYIWQYIGPNTSGSSVALIKEPPPAVTGATEAYVNTMVNTYGIYEAPNATQSVNPVYFLPLTAVEFEYFEILSGNTITWDVANTFSKVVHVHCEATFTVAGNPDVGFGVERNGVGLNYLYQPRRVSGGNAVYFTQKMSIPITGGDELDFFLLANSGSPIVWEDLRIFIS